MDNLEQFILDCVEKFGSPLYLYNLDVIEHRVDELKAALPDSSRLLYSIKANPNPSLVSSVTDMNIGLEVSSVGEIDIACTTSVPPSEWLYTGPGKTEDEICLAIDSGVRFFSCESWTELSRLRQAAEAAGVILKLLLRINPSEAANARVRMGGVASQFGIPEMDVLESPERLQGLEPFIDLVGLHIYLGSQMAGVDAIQSAVQVAVDSVLRLSNGLNRSWDVVDLGGGFPWPYASDCPAESLAGLSERLVEVCRPLQETGCRLWFESGRYLVASSGCLVSRVVDIKCSNEQAFMVLDTGIHHLGGMVGLGRLPRPKIEVLPVSRDAVKKIRANIVGPLCTPLDNLGRGVDVSRFGIGDLVVIPNAGAYGLTASLVMFISRPLPVEVVHRGGSFVESWRMIVDRMQLS